jgi:hypothetical protein
LWPANISLFNAKIDGIHKLLILGALVGTALGAFGGSLYGNALERAELERELQAIREGRVNYNSLDGKPDQKIASYIRAECRANGLSVGIPLGFVLGTLGGGVVWLMRRLASTRGSEQST